MLASPSAAGEGFRLAIPVVQFLVAHRERLLTCGDHTTIGPLTRELAALVDAYRTHEEASR